MNKKNEYTNMSTGQRDKDLKQQDPGNPILI